MVRTERAAEQVAPVLIGWVKVNQAGQVLMGIVLAAVEVKLALPIVVPAIS